MNKGKISLPKRKTIIVFIIIAFVIFAFYKIFYLNYFTEKNVEYPQYEPYLGTLTLSNFTISFEDAKKNMSKFLSNIIGIDTSQINITGYRVIRTPLAIKDDAILIIYFHGRSKYSHSEVHIELAKGRIVYTLLPGFRPYELTRCNPELKGSIDAKKLVKQFLSDLGFDIINNDDLDVKIKEIRCMYDCLIRYELLVKGYRIIGYLGKGTLETCFTLDKIYYYEFVVPDEVLIVYERGLFIDPPRVFPIDRGKASELALNFLKKHYRITEYEERYQGIFWYFRPIPGAKNELGRQMLDPVPHLVYIFKFRFAQINGRQLEKYVYVDTINGDVGFVYFGL